MATERAEALSAGELIEELESIRKEFRKDVPYNIREIKSQDEFPRLAAGKRKAHMGGDINHRFEGERYLHSSDKATRRMQLRKLVDEGGQDTVGGPQVSHPTLSRWESYSYGLTPQEVTELEMGDTEPQQLVARGWWISLMRESYFGVAIGSGMVAEGETGQRSKDLLEAIARDRERFVEWGVDDPDKALMNRFEHAGVDIEHGEFNANTVRRFVTTPELQDEMRKAFIIRLQNTAGA
jgi:pyrroloquinoline quinone (PQQ) biosynthesis protein C